MLQMFRGQQAQHFCRIHYQRLIAPYVGSQTVTKTEPAGSVQESQQNGDQPVTMLEAPSSSDVGDDEPVTAAGRYQQPAEGVTQEAVLEDSTMLQHNAVLNARLQNQSDSSIPVSAREDDIAALPDVLSTFKSTLVDSNGPIPGL